MAENIQVKQSVLDYNERMAAELSASFAARGVLAVNVMGAPGAGKTSVLINIAGGLDAGVAVIEGDIASDIDTRRLASLGIEAVQVNTGGACHLDVPLVRDAAERISRDTGYLFIENIGNLVCPAEFMIGEHVKMLVCDVAGGSDKPYKYPLAFEKADIILVNKSDLMESVGFDRSYFEAGVRALNNSAPVCFVTAKTTDITSNGFLDVINWLIRARKSLALR